MDFRDDWRDSTKRGLHDEARGGVRGEARDGVRIHAVVSGMVQGVGYRYFTVTTALKLGLTGWVRNLMNGDVELEAQGARGDVAMLISRLKLGPKWSEVSRVAVDEIEPVPAETNFRVRGY